VVGGLDVLSRLEAVPTDSTDTPQHEIQITEAIVFVNPFETDLKAYYEEKADKEQEEKREAERKRRREVEDKEGHSGWYSNPAGAATSKAVVYKEGVGKYIPRPQEEAEGSSKHKALPAAQPQGACVFRCHGACRPD
jgi:peptidyl-prolyl cis-trans isomerase-like protein 2